MMEFVFGVACIDNEIGYFLFCLFCFDLLAIFSHLPPISLNGGGNHVGSRERNEKPYTSEQRGKKTKQKW